MMNIIETVKGWWNRLILKNQIQKEFKVEAIQSPMVDLRMSVCASAYEGNPGWADADDHIKTCNFAKTISEETARLVTLGIGIKIDGGARAKWLQEQVEKFYFNLRDWTEYGAGYGTVILKPDGENVDVYMRGQFEATHQTAGEIDGAVFMTVDGDYTRLEDHRFLPDGTYQVTNKAYKNEKPIRLKDSPWADLKDVVYIAGLEKPLFGVLQMPAANNLDPHSPYRLPIFAGALTELEDLDVAYSRNSKEILDSKRTVMMDSDKLLPSGSPVKVRGADGRTITPDYTARAKEMRLPDCVRVVQGNGNADKPFYEEINPQLQTETRITGINNLLSQIGFKCGFSNGYFVFDEKTGMVTATQVEADDRRTIQLVKDVRDRLEDALNGLLYAIDKFADLYDLAPVGTYKIVYDFGDITYNREEDRLRWWGYVTAGKVPAWRYFVKFEGMTEAEAKAMEKEAAPKEPRLFGAEE